MHQRGIPKDLLAYTYADLREQFDTPKNCNTHCTIGCARTASATDEWRSQRASRKLLRLGPPRDLTWSRASALELGIVGYFTPAPCQFLSPTSPFFGQKARCKILDFPTNGNVCKGSKPVKLIRF